MKYLNPAGLFFHIDLIGFCASGGALRGNLAAGFIIGFALSLVLVAWTHPGTYSHGEDRAR